MTAHGAAGADEARAVAMLQQLAVMCDETRRTAASDPVRINDMLEVFEETLAMLAPVLERIGASPNAARDTVFATAQRAADSHRALLDAMGLELERLGRALTESDQANHAMNAYARASRPSSPGTLQVTG